MDTTKVGGGRAHSLQAVKAALFGNASLVGLVLVALLFQALTGGKMLTGANLLSLFSQSFQLMLGCMAASFLFSQGALDLTMGNTAAFAALLGARVSGTSIWLTLAVCIGAAVLVSLVNGTLYVHLKLPIFILGLSVSFILGGFLQPLSGNSTVSIPYRYLGWNNNGMKLVVLLVFFVALGYLFVFSPVGKQMKALGAGELAATQSGINVNRMKRLAFLLSGVTVGVVAFTMLLRDGGASYDTGSMFEFNVMVALVLGGMPMGGGAFSRFRCAIVGALLLTVITNGLTIWGINASVQSIIKAAIFIVVLALGTLARARQEK